MHIRESKLWQVVLQMIRFMGGWGVCATGRDKVDGLERMVIRGWTTHNPRLDQCNVRGWILADVLITAVITLISFGFGALVGSMLLTPLFNVVTGNWSSELWSILPTAVIVHGVLILFNFGKGETAPRWLRAYGAASKQIAVWVSQGFMFLGSWFASAPSTAANKIKQVSFVETVRKAGAELKAGVCDSYDVITPDLQRKRLVTFIEDRRDDMVVGCYHAKFILCTENPEAWAEPVVNQVLTSYRAYLQNGGTKLDEQTQVEHVRQAMVIAHPNDVAQVIGDWQNSDGPSQQALYVVSDTSISVPDDGEMVWSHLNYLTMEEQRIY